jgi:hypothetical protein
LIACIVIRNSFAISNPIVGMGICGLIVAVTTVAILALLPGGRRALLDVKYSISLLRRGDPKIAAALTE